MTEWDKSSWSSPVPVHLTEGFRPESMREIFLLPLHWQYVGMVGVITFYRIASHFQEICGCDICEGGLKFESVEVWLSVYPSNSEHLQNKVILHSSSIISSFIICLNFDMNISYGAIKIFLPSGNIIKWLLEQTTYFH